MGGVASSDAERATGQTVVGDGGDSRDVHPEPFDTATLVLGGLLAGPDAIALEELTQAMLALRRRVPLRLSARTAAVFLHPTIVSPLVSNVILIGFVPSITGADFAVPFGVGIYVALGCLFGDQIGALLKHRLDENTVMQMLITVYFLVGCLVTARTLLLDSVH